MYIELAVSEKDQRKILEKRIIRKNGPKTKKNLQTLLSAIEI